MLFKIKQADTCTSTSTDSPFDKLVEDITSNKWKIRTFSNVHESYGSKECCKAVLAKLQKHFDDQLIVSLCSRTLQSVGVP